MLQVSALPQALRMALLLCGFEWRAGVPVAQSHVHVDGSGVVGGGSAEGTLGEDHAVSSEEVDYCVVDESEGSGTDLTAEQSSGHLSALQLRAIVRLGDEGTKSALTSRSPTANTLLRCGNCAKNACYCFFALKSRIPSCNVNGCRFVYASSASHLRLSPATSARLSPYLRLHRPCYDLHYQ